MGLFDTFINSYKPLGEKYLNAALQSKSLYCELAYYWISPNGELYKRDDSECFTIQNNPKYIAYPRNANNIMRVPPFVQVSTGKHAKLSPCYITKKVELHAGVEDTSWTNITLYFKLGQLQTYKFETYEFPTFTK